MSQLIVTPHLPGTPVTQVIGGEIQGKGVVPQGQDNAGTVLSPNGQTQTPAVNSTRTGPNKR